jgi:hypothetical protein
MEVKNGLLLISMYIIIVKLKFHQQHSSQIMKLRRMKEKKVKP